MLDIRLGLDGYWHAAVRSARDDKLHSVASGPCRATVEEEAQETVLNSVERFIGSGSQQRRESLRGVLFDPMEEVRRS